MSGCKACVQCLIGSVAACPGPSAVELQYTELAGAYVMLVGALCAGVDVDVKRLAVSRLPRKCRMLTCIQCFRASRNTARRVRRMCVRRKRGGLLLLLGYREYPTRGRSYMLTS